MKIVLDNGLGVETIILVDECKVVVFKLSGCQFHQLVDCFAQIKLCLLQDLIGLPLTLSTLEFGNCGLLACNRLSLRHHSGLFQFNRV